MNENTNIIETPAIAEAKEAVRPSHQVLALRNEIEKFAGTHADLLEEIKQRDNMILDLLRKIEGGPHPRMRAIHCPGYKEQIAELKKQVADLEEELNTYKYSIHNRK